MTQPRRYSAHELAHIIGSLPPTDEQVAVIEAPLEPFVVVAGAGSGKTTVVAQRVLYLVANGIVDAQAVLGLTFTRKAVGELSHRIREGLAKFRAATGGAHDPHTLGGLDVPSVQTYNSYAAGIVRDFGLSIGVESDTTLLDDASAALLAGQVFDEAAVDEIPADGARSAIVKSIVELSGQIDEHLTTPQTVIDHVNDSLRSIVSSEYFFDLSQIVAKKRSSKEEMIGRFAPLAAQVGDLPGSLWPADLRERIVEFITDFSLSDQVARLVHKRRLAHLTQRFRARKRKAHQMQFSDQVAFAHQIMTTDPTAADRERSRWQIVLLDEFQDTSDSQTRLLRALFRGLPVMAVGDPRQSIYGWRGASAATIADFPTAFAADDSRPATVLSLTTSWRNSQAVLDVANALSQGLPDVPEGSELTPAPNSAAGRVEFSLTIGANDPVYGSEQMAELASWMQNQAGTRAVLCRKRSHFAPVVAALEAAGLDVVVVGKSGGLDDPFVADTVAALNAALDPTAGNHLMRLLSGSQCALGAADIESLERLRRSRARRIEAHTADTGLQVPTLSLAECVDDLLTASGSRQLEADITASGLTDSALRRIRRLAGVLRGLRAPQTVTSLVRSAVRDLQIDAEIEALPPALATEHRAAVDSLLSTVSGWAASQPTGTAVDLLAWLELAQEADALAAPSVELNADEAKTVVSVMTIHASKGLEFDAVAIPYLLKGDLPGKLRDGYAWLKDGRLPFALRGDRDKQPHFDFTTAQWGSQKQIESFVKNDLKSQLEAQLLVEDTRLAYVAVTRAKAALWLGASLYVPTRIPPQEWSEFLLTAIDALGEDVELPTDPGEAPQADAAVAQWPTEPAVRELAVRSTALRGLEKATPLPLADVEHPLTAALARRAQDLLAERAHAHLATSLPQRLSTTNIVRLAADRDEFLGNLARPMPSGPAPAASLGTAFHAWVEQFWGQGALSETTDDDGRVPPYLRDRLDAMCRTFEESEYATREPLAVELPFELEVAGTYIPGKIDAVFPTETGVEIVDWKTGAVPEPDQLDALTLQLSIYALAVSRMNRFAGAPITASFYYVLHDRVIRPRMLHSQPQIEDLLRHQEVND